MTFSDHHQEVETLKEFGGVIRAIRPASDDDATRFWAFIDYVSEHHSGILKVNLEPAMRAKVASILRGITLPEVTLREPGIHRQRARESNDDT